MRRPLILLVLGALVAAAAPAQMEETLQSQHLSTTFDLAPANPPTRPRSAGGAGQVAIQAIRSHDTGELVRAWVSFFVRYRFGFNERDRLLSLQIVDSEGNILVDSGMRPRNVREGSGEISEWVEVTGADALSAIESLLADPEQAYLCLKSITQPGGLLQGVLRTKELHAIRENGRRIDSIHAIVRAMAQRMSIPVKE